MATFKPRQHATTTKHFTIVELYFITKPIFNTQKNIEGAILLGSTHAFTHSPSVAKVYKNPYYNAF
jgi:hypothetical protein